MREYGDKVVDPRDLLEKLVGRGKRIAGDRVEDIVTIVTSSITVE